MEEKKKNKKLFIGIFIVLLIIILISILVGVRYSKRVKPTLFSFSLNPEQAITETSQIEADKSFHLTKYTDTKIYDVSFSSSSPVAEIGRYPDPEFIYGVRGNEENIINLEIDNYLSGFRNVTLLINVIKDGEITLLNSQNYTLDLSSLVLKCEIRGNDEIYIHSFSLSYYL